MAYNQLDLVATGVVFPTIGFAMVCLRFWMRRNYQGTYVGIDDWCILVASILAIGMAVNSILGSHIGLMGMDGLETDESRELPQRKLVYSVLIFEKPAYGTIKLSVLLFYRRIFTIGRFRAINNYLIALVVAWTLAFFLADFLACGSRIDANWLPEAESQPYCVNLFVLLLLFAITDILTDISIMWMPYPEIKKLHLPAKDRWGLAGVFLLGTIDLITGIVRLGFVIANQTNTAVQGNLNPLDQSAPTFWTVVEVSIGVIAANLPALFPLFNDSAKLGSQLSFFFSTTLGFRTRDSTTAAETTTGATSKPTYSGLHADNRTCTNGYKLREQSSVENDKQKQHQTGEVGIWSQYERGYVHSGNENEHVRFPSRAVLKA